MNGALQKTTQNPPKMCILTISGYVSGWREHELLGSRPIRWHISMSPTEQSRHMSTAMWLSPDVQSYWEVLKSSPFRLHGDEIKRNLSCRFLKSEAHQARTKYKNHASNTRPHTLFFKMMFLKMLTVAFNSQQTMPGYLNHISNNKAPWATLFRMFGDKIFHWKPLDGAEWR